MEHVAIKNLPESVDLLVLDNSGQLLSDVSLEELPGYLSDPGALVWCDISSTEGGQSGVYGRFLREVFQFNELTIEDCFTTSHLPKVDLYDEYLFVVLFSFHLSKNLRVHTVEVDMYIGSNYVVCIHPRPLRELSRVRQRLVAGHEFTSSSAANVAHTVFDAVVDEYLPIMHTLSAQVDEIEDRLLDEDSKNASKVLDFVFHLKHELSVLRRIAIPQRENIGILLRPTTHLIPDESQMHFLDVRDHLFRVVDMIDTMRDYLAGSLDIYTTRTTQRINESTQRLTAVATIVLPLTLITSIYGMNFQYMPELQWKYGYFVVLAFLLLSATGMLIYLRRNRML